MRSAGSAAQIAAKKSTKIAARRGRVRSPASDFLDGSADPRGVRGDHVIDAVTSVRRRRVNAVISGAALRVD